MAQEVASRSIVSCTVGGSFIVGQSLLCWPEPALGQPRITGSVCCVSVLTGIELSN